MSLLISTFYREAPREATVTVAGGLAETTNRAVNVSLSTADHVTGFNNVTKMKIWGDIDPNFEPEFYAPTEVDAKWLQYEPTVPIVLTAGNGLKTLSAKLMNASDVETKVMTKTVTLKADPHPTVLWTDEQQIPPAGGSFQFGWSSSHDWDTMVVVQAPSDEATFTECEQLIEVIGPGYAGVHYTVTVRMPELAAQDIAPTQSGVKMLRIFISANGNWYSLPIVPEPFRVGVWDESVWDGDDRWG